MMIGVKGSSYAPETQMRPDRRTDGQTDMVIPVYPPNFVAGGIITFIFKSKKEVSLKFLLYSTEVQLDTSIYQKYVSQIQGYRW